MREDEHGPAIGVIDLPALGETVYAGRGLGCFSNDDAAHVSGEVIRVDGGYTITRGSRPDPEMAT